MEAIVDLKSWNCLTDFLSQMEHPTLGSINIYIQTFVVPEEKEFERAVVVQSQHYSAI